MGDVTEHARLRQAQAFLRLRQMERTWTRLRPLVDAEHPARETYETAAEYYLIRGWTEQARDLLTRAFGQYPDDKRLQSLWDRAAEPAEAPAELPHGSTAITLEQHLPIAEAYLASGQVLSGRSLLERLGRQHPEDERVQDLLWGLSGDYLPEDQTIGQLVDTALPNAGPLPDLADEEHTESIRHTGEVTLEEPRSSDEDSRKPSFPSLFRGSEAQAEPTDEITEEVTAARKLDVIQPPDPFSEDSPTEIDTGGDTRILNVIDLATAVTVNDEDEDEGGPRPLDGVLRPSYATDLEDEDDDLVVLTNRRPAPVKPPPPDEDPTLSQVGREVAHLLGPPKKKRKTPATPITETAPQDDAPLLEPDPPTDPSIDPPTRSAIWIWALALVMVLVIGLGLAAGLLVLVMWL